MVALVTRMLELHKRKAVAKTPPAIKRLEDDVAAADREIDNLVYELYGLTAAEIKIIESS